MRLRWVREIGMELHGLTEGEQPPLCLRHLPRKGGEWELCAFSLYKGELGGLMR